MRILLTGPTGQVGWELAPRLGALGGVVALDRPALDLADAGHDRVGPGEIEACVVERNHFAERPERSLELPADLAVPAREKDPQS